MGLARFLNPGKAEGSKIPGNPGDFFCPDREHTSFSQRFGLFTKWQAGK